MNSNLSINSKFVSRLNSNANLSSKSRIEPDSLGFTLMYMHEKVTAPFWIESFFSLSFLWSQGLLTKQKKTKFLEFSCIGQPCLFMAVIFRPHFQICINDEKQFPPREYQKEGRPAYSSWNSVSLKMEANTNKS